MRIRVVLISLVFLFSVVTAQASPVHLRCNSVENPIGIDSVPPQFSWQSNNTERNWRQSAYQILVASSVEKLGAGASDVWDSGKVMSAESLGIAYGGPEVSCSRFEFRAPVGNSE